MRARAKPARQLRFGDDHRLSVERRRFLGKGLMFLEIQAMP
jgi:hypothetical protein